MMSIDALFGLSQKTQSTQIINIPIIKLVPYDNQPFKLYDEKKLNELANDIKLNGLLSPIVVRPLDTGMFQVLAGHNRVNAMMLNNENVVPAIVKQVSDAEADLILVQSNLQQRQELSNSEKAKAYSLRNEALKKIGKKNRGNHRSLEQLAEDEKDSSRTIARYIKATQLVKDLMERFDNNEFSLGVAEQLASLDEKSQLVVDTFLEEYPQKLSTNHAIEIVNISQDEQIDGKTLENICSKRKAKIINKVTLTSIVEKLEEVTPLDTVKMKIVYDTIEVLKNMKLLKNIDYEE